MAGPTDSIINAITHKLAEFVSGAQLEDVRNSVIIILRDYDITAKSTCTDLVISNADQRPYMMFFVAKKIEGLSDRSLSYYKHEIDKFWAFIGGKNWTDITTDDIRFYLAMRSKTISKVTLKNNFRILSSFFGWLYAEEYILKNPMLRVHKIKTEKIVKQAFTEDDIEHLRDACADVRELAIIDVLLSTGMRAGEMAILKTSDIDWRTNEVKVFGKGSKERICYLNAKAKKHLLDYLKIREDNECPYVFVGKPSGGGARLGIGSIEKIVRELGVCAGVAKVHPHRFRRTAATIAINRGMPAEQVQQMLGHEQINTTMQYAIVAQNNVKIAHGKFLS